MQPGLNRCTRASARTIGIDLVACVRVVASGGVRVQAPPLPKRPLLGLSTFSCQRAVSNQTQQSVQLVCW